MSRFSIVDSLLYRSRVCSDWSLKDDVSSNSSESRPGVPNAAKLKANGDSLVAQRWECPLSGRSLPSQGDITNRYLFVHLHSPGFFFRAYRKDANLEPQPPPAGPRDVAARERTPSPVRVLSLWSGNLRLLACLQALSPAGPPGGWTGSRSRTTRHGSPRS